MERFGLKFHHLGLAASQPDLATRFMAGLGYRIGAVVHDPLQKVNLVMCESDRMPAVEVISPAAGPGPLDRILAQNSELIYHLCYETEDLARSVEQIKRDGHRIICVSPAKPAVLFGYRPVSFYMVKGFGVIEILEPATAEAPA
jgi:methylmalonyl-CoA/ethylmalonyl-CoA epimerase